MDGFQKEETHVFLKENCEEKVKKNCKDDIKLVSTNHERSDSIPLGKCPLSTNKGEEEKENKSRTRRGTLEEDEHKKEKLHEKEKEKVDDKKEENICSCSADISDKQHFSNNSTTEVVHQQQPQQQNKTGNVHDDNKTKPVKISRRKKKRSKYCAKLHEKSVSVMIRANYLLQAAFFLNRSESELSQRYIKLMKRICNKHLIRLSKQYKKLFCKKCYTVLIPGVTCNISIQQLNPKKRKKINESEKANNMLQELQKSTEMNRTNLTDSQTICLACYKCKECKHITKCNYTDSYTFDRNSKEENETNEEKQKWTEQNSNITLT